MARVLFRVSYVIPDGKRSDYLALIAKLRQFYAGEGIEYGVYEAKGRHNHFQEVYVYPSLEAYEASDEPTTNTDAAAAMETVYAMATDIVYDVAHEVR